MIPIRLWHYKLFPYLPQKQLVSQWRELCLIFSKVSRFIIIDYVYEYPKENLYQYTLYLLEELFNRNINIKQWKYFIDYFKDDIDLKNLLLEIQSKSIIIQSKYLSISNPFPNHQTDRYLFQCYINLQEKYERGQKDFYKYLYEDMSNFIYVDYLSKINIKDLIN